MENHNYTMLQGKKDYICVDIHDIYASVHMCILAYIHNFLKYFFFKYSICKTCLGKKGLKITEVLLLVVFILSNLSTMGKYHFYNEIKL